MHEHRQPSSTIRLARKCSRPLLHTLTNRTLEQMSAGESLLGNCSKVIGNKDQMDSPTIIERPNELPHAIARIGLQHLDVVDLPVRSSQPEHFGELRQVAGRLKQPEIPRG